MPLPFGDLRSLLHAPPDIQVWEDLCLLLTRWPDAEERDEQLIPYALDALTRWPDALRVAPEYWVDHALRGHHTPLLRLATCLQLTAREPLGLTNTHLRALAGQPLDALRSLHIHRAALDANDLDHLLSGASWPAQLHTLRLDHNLLGADAAALLTQAPLHALEHLHLEHNHLRDEGAQVLAHAAHALPLTSLHLSANHISMRGAHALANASALPHLRRLDLSHNMLSREHHPMLREAPGLSLRVELLL
jgi:hypothetical protein